MSVSVSVCLSLSLSVSRSVCLSVSLSPSLSPLHMSYFAEFVCCKVLDSKSFLLFFCLRRILVCSDYLYSLLFDVLSVAVFVIRDRFVKKQTCA